ncbi:DUF397 domain-containing protein [Nocardiopsis sp. NPDC101807]|uniref:DUF397 domain-containing protein n=1 Tax=Nocardiopsis sp. NPDC101807 TaxID=3364339 RepID=UPI0038243BC2
MNTLTFRRSSYSGGSNNCVEVADAPNLHAVRDSKSPEQAPLAFDRAEWRAFLSTAQSDQP